MDIDSTDLASVHPKRRTALFANRAATVRKLLELQRMFVVGHMAELFRELGAEWMGVEIAVFAPVEQPLNRVPTNVADSLVQASAAGLTENQSEVVVMVDG